FFLPTPRPPCSTLFPYTTLFRSDFSVGCGQYRPSSLQHNVATMLSGECARDADSILIHTGRILADQPCHLSRMGSHNRWCLSFSQPVYIERQIVEPIGVDDPGHL